MAIRPRIHVAAVALLAAASLARTADCAEQQPRPAVEPDAIAAIDRMGAYLRTLKAFSVRSDTTIDEVTVDGAKIQFGGTVTLLVQRPNRLRMEIDSDRKQRQLFYDGANVTLFGPRNGYYATVAAPATLGELVDVLEAKHGLNLPLSDLFRWGVDEAARPAIKEAALIGPSKIGGVLCDHVLVRQDDVDWQVWIARGKEALPRKLVITTKSEPAQPQYVALMQWNLAPKLDAATFRFAPPKNARRIPLASADAAPGTK